MMFLMLFAVVWALVSIESRLQEMVDLLTLREERCQ